jgi:hypothetical protein
VSQVVQSLPSKCEALSSKYQYRQEKKKEKELPRYAKKQENVTCSQENSHKKKMIQQSSINGISRQQ